MRRKKLINSCLTLGMVALLGAQVLGQAIAASTTIETQDNKFSPAVTTAVVGDTITFKNTGKSPHTATAKDGSFDTGNLSPGDSKTITLKTAGTIDFVCTYHASLGMKGSITVTGSAGAPPTTGSQPVNSSSGTTGGPAVPGDDASPTAKPAAKAAKAPAPPPPPSEKYFPIIAFLMLAALAGLMGVGYIRTTIKSSSLRG